MTNDNGMSDIKPEAVLYTLKPDVKKNKGNIREHMARLIINGTIDTDVILPNENLLAEGFEISRTSIRDILRSLEEKGLIQRKTHVGTRVRSIHSWNLLDNEVLEWSSKSMSQRRFFISLIELRMIIEPQAAALAATRANDNDLKRIFSAFNLMVKKSDDGTHNVINPDGDILFHQAILKASGNIFVSQFGGAIKAALHHTINMSVIAADNHQESIDNHRELFDAIECRDPEKAYISMNSVLGKTLSDLGVPKLGIIIAKS